MKHPEFIEFEIGSYCNRTCNWCPNALNSRGHEKNHVSAKLWRSFLYDLYKHSYSGLLAIHNYNEPLLDPYVYERIGDVKNISPQTKMAIFTNGDPLNEVSLKKLTLLGIHELRVTLYPKADKIGELKDYGLDKLLKRIKMKLSDFISEDTSRGKEYRSFINDVNLLIIMPSIENYTNRGGSLVLENQFTRVEPCHLPDHSVAIDYLGNFKLCCQLQNVMGDSDYNIGNVGKDGFFTLWNSEKLERIRTQLRVSDFNTLKHCSSCDHSKDYENKQAA